MTPVLRIAVSSLLVVGAVAAQVLAQPSHESSAALRYAMLVAEDARPASRADAAPLLRGLASPSTPIVRQAVRAIGRLEQAEYLPELRQALADADPGVRAEAANAIAQVAAGNPDGALTALRTRFETERDPVARGSLCDALGRLPFASSDARMLVERLLARALGHESSALPVRLGAARGLESLVRRARGTPFAVGTATIEVLRTVALGISRPIGLGDEDRVRLAAVLALNAAGAADTGHERLAMDRDWQIRRVAVAAAMAPATDTGLRARLIKAGLADVTPAVRYEALRAHGRHLAAEDCQPEMDAVQDPNPHVALLAIDLLATACPARADVAGLLSGLTTMSPTASSGAAWHRQAHGLVALARRAPDQARPVVATAASHASWQVRVYAARAATVLGDGDTLTTLATDSQSNVRAAAIDGLRQVRKHDADAVYRSALARPDYPVVMAAARALEGTLDSGAATAVLLGALATLTAEGRDTSRDARLAILDRLAETGGAPHAAALTPYLADADPRVAARVAELLVRWTGESQEVKTTRLRTLALPPLDELAMLPTGLRVTMADGRSFDIRFYLDETPVAVWRIVRLARQGYYDNLTWHRIVPNFIIQGGSPGADEFVGDGPFMRDAFSMRSHVRGTVGVSTRGRDTGDAQLFINVVDSPRLDHDYTVIGEVVAGLDVVDMILEGDVIGRVDLLGIRG